MKFKRWLEGFGVDYDLSPIGQDIETLDAKKKKSAIDSVYQSNAINFSPEDRPEDFIKIGKLNQLQQLSVPKRLPSFRQSPNNTSRAATYEMPATEGASILYGMKFNVAGEKIAAAATEEIKQLNNKLNTLNKNLKSANALTLSKSIQNLIDEKLAFIKEKGFSSKEFIQNKLPILVRQALPEEKKLTTAAIIKYIDAKEQGDVDPVRALRAQRKQLKAEIDALKARKDNKPLFLNIVQQAFLKKLKEPRTPEDKQLHDEFVRLAVENYVNVRPNFKYDYVVYPESRSMLNFDIASALAKHYGARPVQGLRKIAQPTIDTTNFINHNPNMDPAKRKSALNKLQAQIASSKGQIKNIQLNRPYVRNWEMSPELSQQLNPEHEVSGLRGRRILLIDDNVASSGTFQAVHQVLQQEQPPKSVHIYTPLYVNFSY